MFAVMRMPEAAAYLDDGVIFAKNYVGMTGQAAIMKAEAISSSVQRAAHGDFRFSILAFDPGHDFRTLFRWKSVHGS